MAQSIKNMVMPDAMHYWLKQREQQSYHAYLSLRRGAKPVCGDESRITKLNDMDIPGDRSKLCNKCHCAMYGFPAPLVSVVKNLEKTI